MTSWNHEQLLFDIANKRPILIQWKGRKIYLRYLEPLGFGGSKRAYRFQSDEPELDDYILILPGSPQNTTLEEWTWIVDDEVEFSHILTSLGLMNPRHVKIYLPIYRLSSYISISFDALSGPNSGVIDMKTDAGTTWKGLLFSDNEAMYDARNWVYPLEPLIEDIRIVAAHGIPTRIDTFNLIVVDGRVRYFGFDISDKNRPTDLSDFQRGDREVSERSVIDTVGLMMDTIFAQEVINREYISGIRVRVPRIPWPVLREFATWIVRGAVGSAPKYAGDTDDPEPYRQFEKIPVREPDGDQTWYDDDPLEDILASMGINK